MDRRTLSRCPVCQGPSVQNADFPQGIKCRMSMCAHNFSALPCPRCGEQSPNVVSYEKGVILLECKECLNRFKHSTPS